MLLCGTVLFVTVFIEEIGGYFFLPFLGRKGREGVVFVSLHILEREGRGRLVMFVISVCIQERKRKVVLFVSVCLLERMAQLFGVQ